MYEIWNTENSIQVKNVMLSNDTVMDFLCQACNKLIWVTTLTEYK